MRIRTRSLFLTVGILGFMRLQELSNKLVEAQAAMQEASTRSEQLGRSAAIDELEAMPELLKSPLLQGLKAELARAEAKLADISERLGHNHPQHRSARAEVRALRGKIAAETGAVTGSLVQSAALAKRQVAQAQRALDEQKDRIIALKREHDQMAVLRRVVESARSAYDEALRRASQTRLESRIDGINVAILSRATPPLRPSSPRVLLKILVAFFAGLAPATGVAVTLELGSRRLRTREDLALWADLPVLAELPALPASTRPRVAGSRRPALLPAAT